MIIINEDYHNYILWLREKQGYEIGIVCMGEEYIYNFNGYDVLNEQLIKKYYEYKYYGRD